MEEVLNNFELIENDDPRSKSDCPFIAVCRDREATSERWVFAALTEDEARELYEELKKYFS